MGRRTPDLGRFGLVSQPGNSDSTGMCRIPYTGEVQTLDTKSFYFSATFLCAAKYLLNSVMVGSLQEEIAGRTDHLELDATEEENSWKKKKNLLLFAL